MLGHRLVHSRSSGTQIFRTRYSRPENYAVRTDAHRVVPCRSEWEHARVCTRGLRYLETSSDGIAYSNDEHECDYRARQLYSQQFGMQEHLPVSSGTAHR